VDLQPQAITGYGTATSAWLLRSSHSEISKKKHWCTSGVSLATVTVRPDSLSYTDSYVQKRKMFFAAWGTCWAFRFFQLTSNSHIVSTIHHFTVHCQNLTMKEFSIFKIFVCLAITYSFFPMDTLRMYAPSLVTRRLRNLNNWFLKLSQLMEHHMIQDPESYMTTVNDDSFLLFLMAKSKLI
jgi:hypothetical protein